MLLKIAFRNLWRRKFRTIITIVAIGISSSMLLFFEQLHLGQHEQMANSGIRLHSGHVVIQHKNFQSSCELADRIIHPEKVMKIIRENFGSSFPVSSRIFTTGSLASSDGNIILDTLLGASHVDEGKISNIPEKITSGKWISGKDGEIVIGFLAAKLLKLDIGTKVQLSIPDLGGNVSRVALRVTGIFTTGGSDIDRGYAVINLSQAQKLLNMGNSVNQISVFSGIDNSLKMASSIRKKIHDNELEVLDWASALPTLSQFILVDTISMYVFLLIIFFIVAAGVLNAILMSVMERTREFGVLKSIGMKPFSIFNLIIIESVLIGLISTVIGFLIGQLISYLTYKYGIDPAAFTGGETMEVAGVGLTERIRTKITFWSIVWTSSSVMLMTVMSALLPAIRAARIIPVKAVRDV